jgi:hypothetical protein
VRGAVIWFTGFPPAVTSAYRAVSTSEEHQADDSASERLHRKIGEVVKICPVRRRAPNIFIAIFLRPGLVFSRRAAAMPRHPFLSAI